MRIEYQLSENGTHTGFRSAQMESAQSPTTGTAASVYQQMADSTPWGDLSLIIGLPHSRVMRALAMGLAQMAAQEEQQAKHEAWLATLARPAYVEKLIAEQDWKTLRQLQNQGKLHPQYEAHLPPNPDDKAVAPVALPEITITPANTNVASAMRADWDALSENPASVTVELSGSPPPPLITPAPAPAKAAKPTPTPKLTPK